MLIMITDWEKPEPWRKMNEQEFRILYVSMEI